MNPPPALDQPLVLIVDDDLIVRALMRAALEKDGFAVIEAGDGREACDLCADHCPELLIVDVVMPEMDGYELCRVLRQRPETAYVPILVATGLDDVPSIATAYEAGATDFISKPINLLILNHRVRYMLRAGRAIEQLRQNQERLVAARDAAESASRAKSEFLANMSHELRTPLNAIIGFSSILRDGTFGALAARYVDYARLIADSGTHLLSIINNILDLAKADADRLPLEEEEVELAGIVELSTSMVADMAHKGQIDFRVDYDDVPPVLHVDPAKLRQILINLLSNAVKFTPAGGRVELKVALASDGDLAFSIADNGIGIPADKMAVALAPFGQVDSGLARKYEGVGLGLPLTKRLIELHGGTMQIWSEPDEGTVVTASFPKERLRTLAAA